MLSATNVFYRKTGFIYTAIVLLIGVVYAFVVPTSINPWVVFGLILLNALPSIFSYFVQAKYRLLMEVDGRKYVITNSETILQLLANIGKILVLFLTDSLILIQAVYCALSLIQLAYLYRYAKRQYPWLNFHEKPNFKAISQKKSVLVHQISGMVFNNTDILLISFFCDFKLVSVYTIYNMFFSQIQEFIYRLISGFSFALGQMFHTDRKRFLKYFEFYEGFYIMGTFIVYTLMAVFLLPLIQIYTKGIQDVSYTNTTLMFLFAVMSLLSNGKIPLSGVQEYAGKFRETRSHAIIEMSINLGITLIAIQIWGVCGALIGTIAALTYRCIIVMWYANRKILERSVFCTGKLWLINGAVFGIIMLVFYVDHFSDISFGSLVLKGLLHSLWIVGVYIAVNFLFNRSIFSTLMELIKERQKK